MKQSIARHIITSHTCFSRGNTPFLLEKHSVSLGETLRSSVYLSCTQLLLTLLLLISGVVGSWGQPVEITRDDNGNTTIDDSEKKLYLIQTNAFQSFYIAPQADNTITTNNILGNDMLWYFLDAEKDGNTQYYYIINNSTGNCIYNHNGTYDGTNGGSDDKRKIKLIDLGSLSDENKEKCKFKIVADGTTGSYNINVKANQTYYGLNKQNGSMTNNNVPIRLTDKNWIHTVNSQWKFIPYNGTFSWPTPPFTITTDLDNKHYYKIHNVQNNTYYISTDATPEKVTYASTESDRMVWYFEEAPADPSTPWFKYYYIINPVAGDRYMYYSGNSSNNSGNQTDKVYVKAYDSENADRYQFVVVQAARGDNDDRVECYAIIPKLLRENLWKSNSIGLVSNSISDGANMGIISSRGADNTAQWTFVSTGAWADPEITCDATGTTATVTITCEAGAEVYYTTNGDTPTATESATNKKYNAPFTVNPGKTTINARVIKPGKDNSNVVTKIIVYKPTITLTADSYTYTGSAQNPVSSVDYVDAGNSGNNIHFETTQYTVSYKKGNEAVTECKNADTYTIILNDVDGDDYIVCGTGNFTISKTPLTVTAKSKAITYSEEPANDGVTYSGFVGGESESVLFGELAYAYNYSQYGDVGSYTITPSGLTATNYNITFTPGTLTVNQKEVGLTWSNYAGLVYNGSAQKPTCELTGIVNDDDVSVSVAGEQTNAGTGYEATASLTGEKVGNYKLPTPATKTFDIAKKTVTVTSGITANNKEYDGTTTATLVCSSAIIDGKLEGDKLTVAAATGTFADKNVGEGKIVTITGFTMGGTSGGNYKAADTGNQTSTTANITQRVATLTWGTAALTYNATAQAPTAIVSNAAEGDNVTVTVTGAQTNVGENYTATAIALSDANYKLPAEGLTCTFTIAAATLTVAAMDKTKVYGDADPALTYSVSGFQGSESAIIMTGALARAEGNDVGDYNITQGTLGAPNYTISFTGAKFTITAATLAITADDKTKIYGAADPDLTYTVTGLKYEDAKESVLSGALARVTGEQVGAYAINQGSLTASNNYTISFTGANLTITKTGLTITANNNSITYGEAPAGSGVTYSGFVEGDDESKLDVSTLDYDYSYTQFGDVGNNYTITPKGLTSDNYDITFVAGTLTVVQKEVGFTWKNTEFTYDGEEHAPTATVKATDLVNSDAIAVTVTGAQTNAGSHTATASALTGEKAGNYVLPDDNTHSFTISPKSIGDGTTIEGGYTFDFGVGNTILLKDDAIGSTLVLDTDYEVSDIEETDKIIYDSKKYSERTVTGKGNYTGSFDVRNVVISFTTDTDQEEWSATFAAEKEKADASDIGLALPEGVMAFIISGIRGEWAIPEPLDYIPVGVPVLLVARKQINGFVPVKAVSGNVTKITSEQKGYNMLEEVTTESASFATKQIYLLYKNEFVFNKAGNLEKGKVYLNPNHITPSPSQNSAPARLMIAWNQTTGIEDGKWKMEDGKSERWYTIDGRRLNGKPTTKGLYIVNGKKIVVK